MLNIYAGSEGGLAGLEKKIGQSTMSDTMKEVIMCLKALHEKYGRMERKVYREEKGVHLNFSIISKCLPDYGFRLEM